VTVIKVRNGPEQRYPAGATPARSPRLFCVIPGFSCHCGPLLPVGGGFGPAVTLSVLSLVGSRCGHGALIVAHCRAACSAD